MSFSLRLNTQRQMHCHLVAVKVRIETAAYKRMKHDSITFDQNRLKGLNTHPVKRRCTVQQHGVLVNHFFENVPYLLISALNHSFGAFDSISQAVHFEFSD